MGVNGSKDCTICNTHVLNNKGTVHPSLALVPNNHFQAISRE
jgi:hypothetical protein